MILLFAKKDNYRQGVSGRHAQRGCKPGNRGQSLSSEARFIGRLSDELSAESRRFVLEFVKWMKSREQ